MRKSLRMVKTKALQVVYQLKTKALQVVCYSRNVYLSTMDSVGLYTKALGIVFSILDRSNGILFGYLPKSLVFSYNCLILTNDERRKMNTKVQSRKTSIDTILGECESIISSVENVIDLCESNDFVTNLLQTEEFENLRYIAEYLQSFVLLLDEKGINLSTVDEIENVSINLYQTCKYTVEALEESIQDTDVLNEFGYIRASVNIIRDVV